MYNSQLQQEADNLKISLGELRKNLTNIKIEIKKLDVKNNKYAEVIHLAESIEMHSKQISVTNLKNFKEMVQRQD